MQNQNRLISSNKHPLKSYIPSLTVTWTYAGFRGVQCCGEYEVPDSVQNSLLTLTNTAVQIYVGEAAEAGRG